MQCKSRIFLIAMAVSLLVIDPAEAFVSPRIASSRDPITQKTGLRGGANGDDSSSEPNQGGFKAKFSFGGGGDSSSKDDSQPSKVAKNEDEGFFRGITKRLPGRRNSNDVESSLSIVREDSTPNPLDGVLEGVDEFRRRIRSIRTSEYLEEVVRSGVLLSSEETEKRLKELDAQLEANKLKQTQLQVALKQLLKEESKTGEAKRREALAKTRELVEAKIGRAKEQRELYQQQRKLVLAASGKVPSKNRWKGSIKSSSSSPSPSPPKVMQPKASSKAPQSSSANGERSVKNVQSVPQSIFDRSKKNSTEVESKGGMSFSNSIAGAQRFMSKMIDSTFQRREQWVVAFPKSRIDPGEVVPIKVAGLELLVVATRDGKKVYAIANSCSHLGTPLETGMVESRKAKANAVSRDVDCIVCPLHQTAFSMETGEVIGDWCPYPPVLGNLMGAVKTKNPVAVFDIRTRGKNIEIKLNSCVKDMFADEDGSDEGGDGASSKKKKTTSEQQPQD